MHPIDGYATFTLLLLLLVLTGMVLWDPVAKWIRRRKQP